MRKKESTVILKSKMKGDYKVANFKVITKEVETVPDTEDTLIIRGIASTTSKDLDDEVVSMAALESMCKQISKLNLHLDHDHGFKGLIGVIKDAELVDNELWITAEIFQEHAPDIRDKLSKGAKLGLSIGGLPVRDKQDPNLIKDFNLLEISLTPMPANQDTQGSVEIIKSCISGACYDYLEEINKMKKKDFRYILTKEELPEEEKPEEEDEKLNKSEGESEYVTIDEVGDILNEFMAEKEEQIKADIIESIKDELDKSADDEDDDEELDKSDDDEDDDEELDKSDDEKDDEEDRKKPLSKYAYYSHKKHKPQNSFLDNDKRDYLGRNRLYI